jgi:hypothetical protein
MNKSDSIGKLAKALSIVQGKLRPAIKDAKNPFFKSNYADLNSVWDSCRQLLAENGLSIAQLNQVAENGVIVETVLMHESGEWISGEMYLPLNKQDAQSVGSAVTYGRRYGLAAVVGIVADEDDDANAAQPQQRQQPNNVKPMPATKAPAPAVNGWICGKQLEREILDLEAALDSKGIGSTVLRNDLEKSKKTRNPATLSKEDAASYRDYLKKKNDSTPAKSA